MTQTNTPDTPGNTMEQTGTAPDTTTQETGTVPATEGGEGGEGGKQLSDFDKYKEKVSGKFKEKDATIKSLNDKVERIEYERDVAQYGKEAMENPKVLDARTKYTDADGNPIGWEEAMRIAGVQPTSNTDFDPSYTPGSTQRENEGAIPTITPAQLSALDVESGAFGEAEEKIKSGDLKLVE